ncbi:MAG: hypothetical protein GY720_15385 [bacterium]|nr:hypothetical protein [bacterium]
MRALIALFLLVLVVGACSVSDEISTTSSTAEAPRMPGESVTSEVQSTLSGIAPVLRLCHPRNDREDCTLVIVLMDPPVDLAAAEAFASEHQAYLNVLYRIDPVCVPKDFPIMGQDLGETPSRRSYWEADKRTDRIAEDIGAGLVPPPTIGGFDVVIDQRISDEWRFARMPGVLFDNVGLWIDAAGATALAADYRVEFPDHWRYEHGDGQGEIALDRHYDPPSLATSDEMDDCVAVP